MSEVCSQAHNDIFLFILLEEKYAINCNGRFASLMAILFSMT